MARVKKPKQKENQSGLKTIHIKVTPSEWEHLEKRANWFCMGNVSAWLRYTGMKYIPKKDENVSQAIAEKKY